MIAFLAEFCAGLGEAADLVVITAYHMPESLDEMGGEAPIFGERNSFHLLVEGWKTYRQRVGWHGVLAPHFAEDLRAMHWYGQEVASKLRVFADVDEATR